ncbi:hypothetical protein AB0K60_31145 [Thermopolyspora sp. NPDC052614]|uniref:hypothetical protein n=1 Tax=Thermopolyspora sp. NPDC052614 TaxID=3155682 RepID=UPI003439126D
MHVFVRNAARITCAALAAQLLWPTPPAAAHVRRKVPCRASALIEAIAAVNAVKRGVLILSPFCDYVLTKAASTGTHGANGLPIVDADLTIHGRGARVTRAAGSPAFRVMEIAEGRTVKLISLTVKGGDPGAHPGGGILVRGMLTMRTAAVQGNTAQQGGGIANDDGRVVLVDSAVEGNEARDGGGGLVNDGELDTMRTRIAFNRARTGGGVLNELRGVATLRNTTVNGNTARTRGGGLHNAPGGISRLFSTVVERNSAHDAGGGIFNDFFTGAVRLSGSTVTANTAGSAANCAPVYSVAGCVN